MNKAETTQGVLFVDKTPPARVIIEKTERFTIYEDGSVKVHSQNTNTEGVFKKRSKRRYSKSIR